MMESMRFDKSPEGVRYNDLQDAEDQLLKDVSKLMKEKANLAADHDHEVPVLPMMFLFILSDMTYVRGHHFLTNEREKFISLTVAKRVAHSLLKSNPHIVKAFIVIEAWTATENMNTSEYDGLSDKEKSDKAEKKYRAGLVEKKTCVMFHHLLPVKDSNNNTTTDLKLVMYDVFEESILTERTEIKVDRNNPTDEINPDFLLFDSYTEDQNKLMGKDASTRFEVMDIIDCIKYIQDLLQSNKSEFSKVKQHLLRK